MIPPWRRNRLREKLSFLGQSKVVTTYVLPQAPDDISEDCDVMSDDLDVRPFPKEETASSAQGYAFIVAFQALLKMGRWYDSFRSLWHISDGKYAQVSIEGDMLSWHVLRATSNGHA